MNKLLYEALDNVMEALPSDVSYYYKMPDFSEEGEPEKWLACTFTDNTDLHADNTPLKWVFFVTVSVCTPERPDLDLNRRIIALMLANGFTYSGGANVSDDEIYPHKAQYALEFTITLPLDLEAAESEE